VDRVWPNGVTILGQQEQPTSMDYPGVVPKPLGNPHPLFNLAKDPAESSDVSEMHPEVVDRLRAMYESYVEALRTTR
jgi:hypothetical protein